MASGGVAPLIRNLDEGEWSASHPDRLTSEKEPLIPTEKEVVCAPKLVLNTWEKVRTSDACLASYCDMSVSVPASLMLMSFIY